MRGLSRVTSARHIPGSPTILPINMPGASGHIAAGHIYNVAAKDGTVIGSTTPGVITDPLWAGDAGRAKFNYDPVEARSISAARRPPPTTATSAPTRR